MATLKLSAGSEVTPSPVAWAARRRAAAAKPFDAPSGRRTSDPDERRSYPLRNDA